MLKPLLGLLALLAASSVTSQAQSPSRAPAAQPPATVSLAIPTPQYDSAYYAWQEGRYPDALAGFERMLTGPRAAEVLEPIALVTGELYVTTELAPDGNSLRWSRDARIAAFTSVKGSERVVHLVSLTGAAPREIATIPGFGLAFSPVRDEAAYLSVTETADLAAARAAFEKAVAAQDFQAAQRARADVGRLEAAGSRIRIRDLATGRDRDVTTTGLSILSLGYGRDGTLYFGGNTGDPTRVDIYAVTTTTPKQITDTPGQKRFLGATAASVIFYDGSINIRNLATGQTQQFAGSPSSALSHDGALFAYVGTAGADTTLTVLTLASGNAVVVKQSSVGIANPSFSPDGKRLAYQMMPREDWEVFVVGTDGTSESRITRDPQDDLFPTFIGNDRLLVLKGEGRHRRSYIYDVATAKETRLFHNNTVRTVSPEYEWAVAPDGSRVLIVADRDGNTISPERSVTLVDLGKKVTTQQVLQRVRAQAAAEKDLRTRGERMFAGIAAQVRPVVADVSSDRVYTYSKALFDMDSRWIAKPGNGKAIEYFVAILKSWGYEPEVQWFEPRPGIRTANVVATLKGTRYPDRIYVMSAHFDSVQETAGSDDDGTGTTALLEAARVMAGHPQPATIEFAFLTGEEAGSLGAREYVRRAVEAGDKIQGVLNNDMGGWVEDGRYDDTIRYASDYLRDVEHAAAIQFTRLITYDARYYRGTDAGVFYNAFGEIAAGIGGYPILASPHYHETHDVLETINPQVIAEIAKTSVASIMLMAQQPELPKQTS